MIQIGIRSPVDRETWDWTVGQGVTVVTGQQAQELDPGGAGGAGRGRCWARRPAYLSFDIDCARPRLRAGHRHAGDRRPGQLAGAGAAAAAGRPAIGAGWMWWRSPRRYDVAEITALAAPTMAWEYLALLAKG